MPKKNLWSDEDYKQVLKGAEDSDQLDDILDKAIHSWESSGGQDWQVGSEESTYYSEFSINWASSYEDSNTGIDSADLIGAQTGELFIVESYVSTYVYSFLHTWVSTGVIVKPNGKVSSWTSRYTTYWTSTWTSSFTNTQMVSVYSSEWTSCKSGLDTWASTYEQEVWDTGSVDSGAHNWDSEFETSTMPTWVSSWESNWESTIKHASSSVWYSASTSFVTNGHFSYKEVSWESGDKGQ